jgi:hypothetical protein
MKLHRISAVGITLFLGLGLAIAGGGCTASVSASAGPDIANCNADSTISCTGGAYGYSCAAGSNPEDEDTTLSCSVPTADGSNDDFCCYEGFTGSTTTCAPDDELTSQCPDPDSYGYQCAAGDDPTSYDASLNCSSSVPDGSQDDFCCTYGAGSTSSGGGSSGGGGDSCTADSSLSCDAGATGVDCPSGVTPDSSFGICSDPSGQSDGSDGYCCVSGETFSDCTQDDSVTATCDYPSFGFSCSSGSPDPSTDDTSLTCSTPTTDPNTGNDLYCCQ